MNGTRSALFATAVLLLLFAPLCAAVDAGSPQGDVESTLSEAQALMLAGDYPAAFSMLTAAAGAAPEDNLFRNALGRAALFTGRAAEALSCFGAAAEAETSAENEFWLALAASARGETENAAAALERALRLAGEAETTLFDLAEKFLRADAPSVSALLYRRVLEVLPKDTMFDLWSRRHLAAHYNLTGRNAAAAEIIDSARKAFEYSDVEMLAPHEVEYLVAYFRGLAAFDAGDPRGGANALRDAAAMFPDGMIAQCALVRRLDEAGMKEEADGAWTIIRKRLKDAIASAPEDAQAYYNLALFASASGRVTPEALRAAEWAVTLAPLSARYFDTHAALLEAFGRHEEALRAANRAMAMQSAPRWSMPGEIDYYVRRRIAVLRALGTAVPDACLDLDDSR